MFYFLTLQMFLTENSQLDLIFFDTLLFLLKWFLEPRLKVKMTFTSKIIKFIEGRNSRINIGNFTENSGQESMHS